MDKNAWAIVVFILFLVSAYDSIDRHLTFTEATFVFSTALLYYNYVWVVVEHGSKKQRHSDKSLFLLLLSSVLIGTIGYFNDDLW